MLRPLAVSLCRADATYAPPKGPSRPSLGSFQIYYCTCQACDVYEIHLYAARAKSLLPVNHRIRPTPIRTSASILPASVSIRPLDQDPFEIVLHHTQLVYAANEAHVLVWSTNNQTTVLPIDTICPISIRESLVPAIIIREYLPVIVPDFLVPRVEDFVQIQQLYPRPWGAMNGVYFDKIGGVDVEE